MDSTAATSPSTRKAIKDFNRRVHIGTRFTIAREDPPTPLELEVRTAPFVHKDGQAYVYCGPPGASRPQCRALPIAYVSSVLARTDNE
jgi:hypothetical protein